MQRARFRKEAMFPVLIFRTIPHSILSFAQIDHSARDLIDYCRVICILSVIVPNYVRHRHQKEKL